MFRLIKEIFVGLLTDLVNGCNHTKCVSLSNQKCMTQPTLVNSHSKECSQEFQYYPFSVKLDQCVGSCNTLNKVCVQNRTKDFNLIVFNMITVINEPIRMKKHISCICKCKLDGTKCNSNQWWHNNKC